MFNSGRLCGDYVVSVKKKAFTLLNLDPWGAQSSITTFHNMLRMLVVPRSQAGEVR